MTIGIAGAGIMGTGVAQCFAAAGHDVLVADSDPDALAGAPDRVRQGLRLQALAGRPVTAPADVLPRIRWTERIGELTDVRFVIECVPERIGVKEEVFRELDQVCPPGTVLASCTSAIPIARLAALTRRPDAVIGTHFMNPAPLKDTVEVVRAGGTSEETISRTVELLARIGKKAVVVGDGPGFVTNRVLMVMVNQAVTALQDGIADAAAVDEIFQSCAGHAMGPLRTADLIGLDTVLDTLRVLRDCTGDPIFQPRPLLVELVRQGRLGRKSGRGFHEYAVDRSP